MGSIPMACCFKIGDRLVGPNEVPFVVPEIGINHGGSLERAIEMVDAAARVGAECVKFQSHIPAEEMIPNDIVPKNAQETIWDIITNCTLSEKEESYLRAYTRKKGLLFLATPFSRAAVDRLDRLDVDAFKIGSGECCHLPLIKHIASHGKPVLLSTGMTSLQGICPSYSILREAKVPFAILHCVSLYPTPYEKLSLGALDDLKRQFPHCPIGLSDHTIGIYTALGAVALGACIIEKHFTSNKSWEGPDIPISIDSGELKELISGSRAICAARGGNKELHPEEYSTIQFAHASVVSLTDIRRGEPFGSENIGIKRPDLGDYTPAEYDSLLGQTSSRDIPANAAILREMVVDG